MAATQLSPIPPPPLPRQACSPRFPAPVSGRRPSGSEAEAAEELKDRRAKEYEKAKAVKMQKKLWQSGLEARIMMQKVLQGTNKLPGSEAHVVMEDVDPTLAQEMRGVASDAKRALGDLCEILDCLAEINPAVISRATGAKPSKRRRVGEEDGLRACWAALDARYTDFG